MVAAILVMNRTLHTNDVAARISAEVAKINSDGSLPPGVKIVPFYERTSLVAVTTKTVMHNLLFGFILIFVIQWLFLGDLRSAIIVGVNIPFALFFSIIILVLRNEDANLLSVGAVDFGIIVDAAVILVENIYRNFQARPEDRQLVLHQLAEGKWGIDPTGSMNTAGQPVWTDRLRLIFISALQIDKAVFFSTAIIIAAFIPLFTMQGVEGQIFSPMARTYAYALIGALLATFTVTPCLASLLLPEHIHEVETFVVRALRAAYTPVLHWSLGHRKLMVAIGMIFLVIAGFLGSRLGGEFLPALEEGNLWIRASMPPTISLEAGMPIVNRIREILLRYPEVITVVSQHGRPDNGSDAAGFFNAEFFVPLKPFDEWPSDMNKEKMIDELQAEFAKEFTGIGFNFSQYIQDNVEEGLSGVRGANSAKIIGPDLVTLEKSRGRGDARNGAGQGHHRSRDLLGARTAQPEHFDRSRQGGPLRPQHRGRQHRRSGRLGRHRRHDFAGGGSAIQRDGSGRARVPQQHRCHSQPQGRLSDPDRQRVYSAERARQPSRWTPAPRTSITSAINGSCRSSSACADAISPARLQKRSSGSPGT